MISKRLLQVVLSKALSTGAPTVLVEEISVAGK